MPGLLENLAGEYKDAGYVNLALVLLYGSKRAGSQMGRDFQREYRGDKDGEDVAEWVRCWLIKDQQYEKSLFKTEIDYQRALYLWEKQKEKKDREDIKKHLKGSGQVIDKRGIEMLDKGK